ncbi:MAG: parallel beta-helix domain-containing protein [Pseudomonadales bacterium]
MSRLYVLLPILILSLLAACTDSSREEEQAAAPESEDPAEALMRQFIEAEPGDTITIAAGTYAMTRSLTLNTDNVTIKGAGMDETILSFKGQLAGAEGILVNASNLTIEDLAIEDTKGDALKINEGKNIAIRRVRTEWTGGPKEENGSYGIYPVQTENTLIEDSVAIGASDAGLYVGQSRNIIVRGNRAEYNVAGIEIENSVGADVHDNVAVNNTGGILVFNMPDLPQEGHSTRVFDNVIKENNTANFAPKGTAVAGVPAGTGILINSNDKVEIFGNSLTDNRTAHVLISSFYSTSMQDREQVPNFDPYPETIYIYDNKFEGGGTRPDRDELNELRVAMFGEDGSFPDIMWDGIVDAEKFENGKLPAHLSICLDNDDATIINVDAANGYQNPDTDATPYDCQHEKLPAVDLAFSTD